MEKLVQRWSELLKESKHPWVVFSHGTVVILTGGQPGLSEQDIRIKASELMADWPVVPGCELGDFGTIVPEGRGVVVTCAHPDILTYVDCEDQQDMAAAFAGRACRNQDAADREIVHVQMFVDEP